MEEFSETKIRHLEAIQGVITRMASNSFALKAIAGTVVAAILAYAGAARDPSPWLAVAGALPALVFWVLDAEYLRLERLFRKLYDGVRRGEVTEPFDMNFARYDSDVDNLFKVAYSWSCRRFYLTLIIVMGGLAFVI